METKIVPNYCVVFNGSLKFAIYVGDHTTKTINAMAADGNDSFKMTWDKENFLFEEWLDDICETLEEMFGDIGITIAHFIRINEDGIAFSFDQ